MQDFLDHDMMMMTTDNMKNSIFSINNNNNNASSSSINIHHGLATAQQARALFAMNATVSSIALIANLLIVLLYVYLRRIRCFSLRMVVHYAVFEFIINATYLMGGGMKPEKSVFCYVQSILLLWFELSRILCMTCMVFSMFYAYVLNRSPSPNKNQIVRFYSFTLERLFLILCWCLPAILMAIGMGLKHNGPSLAYCYVDTRDGKQSNWEYLYYYGFLWIAIAINVILVVCVAVRQWQRSISAMRLKNQQESQAQKSTVNVLQSAMSPTAAVTSTPKRHRWRRHNNHSPPSISESRSHVKRLSGRPVSRVHSIEMRSRSPSITLTYPPDMMMNGGATTPQNTGSESMRRSMAIADANFSLNQTNNGATTDAEANNNHSTAADYLPPVMVSPLSAVSRTRGMYPNDELSALSTPTEDTFATTTYFDGTEMDQHYDNDYDDMAYTENIEEHEDTSLYHLRFYFVVFTAVALLPSINRIYNTSQGTQNGLFWLSMISLLSARLSGVFNLIVYICNFSVIVVAVKQRLKETQYMIPALNKTERVTRKAANDAQKGIEKVTKIGSRITSVGGGQNEHIVSQQQQDTMADLTDEMSDDTFSVSLSSIGAVIYDGTNDAQRTPAKSRLDPLSIEKPSPDLKNMNQEPENMDTPQTPAQRMTPTRPMDSKPKTPNK